ncbi:MAG TPA: response regulator transcription factor [Bacillota bacterium]|nr:response regulator transcription factor [Bacillota bacterium]
MYVLLAEDDRRLGKLIVHMLKQEFHTVDWVDNGKDAYEYALCSDYDVIVLDWMMPVMEGVQVCQKLRQRGYQSPILMLTAKDAVEDRVQGLDSGADDYLVKPFSFNELFARLRALSRRREVPITEDMIQVADLRLDRVSHKVWRDDQEIQLTTREYQLMELFMLNQGQILPRDVIIVRVWGYDTEVTSNALDAFIRLLRKKIELEGKPKLIHNVRGVGYKLEVKG